MQSAAQRAQAESDKTFHEMLQAVERWKAEINQMIMANMQSAMSQADGYVERLEQEIMELQRRDTELRQVLETEDNIHFLQVKEMKRPRLNVNAGASIAIFFFFCRRISPPCASLPRPWCPKSSSTPSSPSAR